MTKKVDDETKVMVQCPNCLLQYTKKKGEINFNPILICPNCMHQFEYKD